jgi:hypothetical protein
VAGHVWLDGLKQEETGVPTLAVRTYENVQSLEELLDVEPDIDPPNSAELFDVRDGLERALNEIVDGWEDRPHGALRINKARLQSTGICHAQVLAETQPFELGSDVALGAICDIAAGIVALHPSFEPADGWYRALEPALIQERADVVSFVSGFIGDQAELFGEMVDKRCRLLPSLVGDIRHAQTTIRERARVLFAEARVLLTAETDLAASVNRSVLAEVKSGSFGPWILDELHHYALVRSLRDLVAPRSPARSVSAESLVSFTHRPDCSATTEPAWATDAPAWETVPSRERTISVDGSFSAARNRSTADGLPITASPWPSLTNSISSLTASAPSVDLATVLPLRRRAQ